MNQDSETKDGKKLAVSQLMSDGGNKNGSDRRLGGKDRKRLREWIKKMEER